MPYRHTEPLRTWTLRTSLGWYGVGVLAALLTVGAPLYLFLSTPYFNARFIAGYLFTVLPGLALVAMFVFGGDGYRIHGGRAEVRLYPDRLEVPRKRKPGLDVLPLDELSLGMTNHLTRINFIPVNDVLILRLVAGPIDRTLSERLFESRSALERMIEDILRVQHGEAPRAEGDGGAGPRDRGARGSDPDALDARIDAELARLD